MFIAPAWQKDRWITFLVRFAVAGYLESENSTLAIFSGSTTVSKQLLKSIVQEVTPLRRLDGVFKLLDYQFNYQTGRNTLGHEFLEITMFKALATKKMLNQSSWNVWILAQLSLPERICIVQYILSVGFRWIKRLKIVSGTKFDLHMRRT